MTKLATKLIKGLVAVAFAASLGACGGVNLLGPSGSPPDVYDLSPKSTFDDDLPTVDWQLVVEEPVASRALDTDRILIKPTPLEIGYISGARWSDRAPRMIQTRLVESYENSGRIVAVGREVIGLRGDYNLKSELREFQVEMFRDGENGSVLVRMNFKLISMPAGEIIASATFDRREEIPGSGNVSDIVTAFDEALGGVMKNAVQWSLRTVEEYRMINAAELGLTGYRDIESELQDGAPANDPPGPENNSAPASYRP